MPFKLRVTKIEHSASDISVSGELVEGSYSGPEVVSLCDQNGRWNLSQINGHGVLLPNGWRLCQATALHWSYSSPLQARLSNSTTLNSSLVKGLSAGTIVASISPARWPSLDFGLFNYGCILPPTGFQTRPLRRAYQGGIQQRVRPPVPTPLGHRHLTLYPAAPRWFPVRRDRVRRWRGTPEPRVDWGD